MFPLTSAADPTPVRWVGQGRKLAIFGSDKEGYMYARIAIFESDPAKIDDAIDMVRSEVESGDTPEGLEGAKMLMLVSRETGKGLGVTLFESEEAMRRGDEALNAMNPGASERRTSVEFYEVPVQTVS
jgi:heme-degrading monooxygenase HmoA